MLAGLWLTVTALSTSSVLLGSTASPLALQEPALAIEARQDSLDTRNDLYDLPCRPVTIIFARGTIEPGNVGLIAGPPFFAALAELVNVDSFAVQGVDYPATIAGYLEGGSPQGAQTFANLSQLASTQCPDSLQVWSGYSQGAQVVHLGAAMVDDEILENVAAVVLFGDPDDGQPINDIPTMKIDTICLTGDLICDGLPIVDPLHLGYGFTAPQAAAFVAPLIASAVAS